MNKKLFSWKALAGLALLVAMGLTSCKQGTEVDPTDPTGKMKPVTPGASTKGSANVTITVVAGTDLVSEYTKWWGTLTTEQKKAITDANEFTIGINGTGYKLDGKALELPAVWSPATDKTLNVVFTTGFAEAKKPLIIDADKYNAGANVNITLPAGEYDMTLLAASVRPVLKSEAGATVKTLNATISSVAKNNLTIGDGVKVNILAADNNVKKAGTGDIVAVQLAAGTYTGEDDGTIKQNGLNFKNLEIAGNVTVKGKAGDKKLNLDNVHISGANTLTVGADVAAIANINGDLTSSKALQANVVSDAIVGKLSKVILASTKTVEIKDGSALDNVEFTCAAKISGNIGTVSSAIFNKNVEIVFDKNNANLTFSATKFNSTISVTGKVESETVKTYNTAKYSVATGWTIVTDDPNVAINDKVVSCTGGKLYDKDGKEVTPAEDAVRFEIGSQTMTTVPENCVISLDKATVDASGLNGSNLTAKFGGVKFSDPGYAVVLNDTKYTWKRSTDSSTVVVYELRK